jgi:hypothetical protein
VARLDDATNTWNEAAGPLNHSPGGDAREPSLTAVDGVPFVAWTEFDGANDEVRVASLRDTGWREVVGGDSPVNRSDARDASYVSLAASGDEPYVAWQEWTGRNYELYVSEWDPGSDEWEPVGDGPVNRDAHRSTTRASLLEIGGVWHVAWSETDGRNFELRVARLNAAGDAWDELVGGERMRFGRAWRRLTGSPTSRGLSRRAPTTIRLNARPTPFTSRASTCRAPRGTTWFGASRWSGAPPPTPMRTWCPRRSAAWRRGAHTRGARLDGTA